MPSFREARRLARKTVCKKNLQTIGLGIHAYLLTNRDTFFWACRLPSIEEDEAAAQGRDPWVPLPKALVQEMKGKSEVYLCPADRNLKLAGTMPKERYYDNEGTSYEWETLLNGIHISHKNLWLLGGALTFPPSDMWMLRDFETFHGPGQHNILYVDFHVSSSKN